MSLVSHHHPAPERLRAPDPTRYLMGVRMHRSPLRKSRVVCLNKADRIPHQYKRGECRQTQRGYLYGPAALVGNAAVWREIHIPGQEFEGAACHRIPNKECHVALTGY